IREFPQPFRIRRFTSPRLSAAMVRHDCVCDWITDAAGRAELARLSTHKISLRSRPDRALSRCADHFVFTCGWGAGGCNQQKTTDDRDAVRHAHERGLVN